MVRWLPRCRQFLPNAPRGGFEWCDCDKPEIQLEFCSNIEVRPFYFSTGIVVPKTFFWKRRTQIEDLHVFKWGRGGGVRSSLCLPLRGPGKLRKLGWSFLFWEMEPIFLVVQILFVVQLFLLLSKRNVCRTYFKQFLSLFSLRIGGRKTACVQALAAQLAVWKKPGARKPAKGLWGGSPKLVGQRPRSLDRRGVLICFDHLRSVANFS